MAFCAAWANVNGDGFPDLLVTRGNQPLQLFINDGHGHFTDDAAARGIDAGDDIMIHGLPNGRGWIGSRHQKLNWTQGCIALTNAEMQWLYASVPDGTPIEIRA